MPRKKVFVTRSLPGSALNMLSKQCDVEIHNGHYPPGKTELINSVHEKDAILCTLSDKIDKEVMDSAGNQLKVISTYSTGYDHIDTSEAKRRGIRVTYTYDVLTESTADLTFGLILSVARKICIGDRFVRSGNWKIGWMPDLLLGSDVYNKTLGIIGLGKIGIAVAKRAESFGMKILYINQSGRQYNKRGYIYKPDLNSLLSESDFVSMHVPLTNETFHLINKKTLSMMKPKSFLINTSRGKIIDEDALIQSLKNKSIAGAALDVFENEPIDQNNPLLEFDNVVLLPHIGSASNETREKMGIVAVENILNIFNGERPLYEL